VAQTVYTIKDNKLDAVEVRRHHFSTDKDLPAAAEHSRQELDQLTGARPVSGADGTVAQIRHATPID
jgi:hypothetical protein